MEKNNLAVWDKVKHPPIEALSKIKGGRLSGNTNISPQWRYKIMTETFGVCGIGWKYEVVNKQKEEVSNDQIIVFVDINLFIKIDEKWSEPIPGNGGSFLIAKETNKMFSCDEAFKMATTDALGTAMKLIGVGSDIYMGMHDGDKYKDKSEEPNGGKNDFGTPTHPFSRDNIIEIGQYSKTGKSKDKKWIELSDEYLKTLNEKVTGGYKKFIEKEIAFRENDQKLKKGKKETEAEEKKVAERKAKIKQEKLDKAKKLKKLAEEALKEAEAEETDEESSEPSFEKGSDIDEEMREETINRINEMKKKGHMKEASAEAWTKIATTLSDPIIFHRFYWAVSTAVLVCEASDAKKINIDTKIGYFDTIKDPKSKVVDFESIMADMNKLLGK